MVRIVLLIAFVAFGTVLADEDDQGFAVRAKLSSFRENPPLFTGATGEFTAEVSEDRKTIAFELVYRDLKGGAAAASHIHVGHAWENGPVVVHLCGTGGKPACPAAGVALKGTIVAGDVIGLADRALAAGDLAALLHGIRAGATYVNVHNATYPAGELRGQIGKGPAWMREGGEKPGRGKGRGPK